MVKEGNVSRQAGCKQGPVFSLIGSMPFIRTGVYEVSRLQPLSQNSDFVVLKVTAGPNDRQKVGPT
jgi:hypothetical protein